MTRKPATDALSKMAMGDTTVTTEDRECSRAAGAGGATVGVWLERHPGAYLLLALLLAAVGLASIAVANRQYAPEMYGSRESLAAIAQALARGDNYAVFDLNLNIRELRDEHIRRLEPTPDVVVLGASHWQEAHAGLLPGYSFYNSHVHRDYYEDMLAVTELWVRHKKLPRAMIITIRDNLFAPVSERRDFLWLPGIPYYRSMARRLWLEAHDSWETLPVQRWRELLSLPMLFNNAERWHQAVDRPRPTGAARLRTLDLLLPDGSIVWSEEHQRAFTPERAERLSVEFAEANRGRPPSLDPKGLETIDALLRFLKSQGVRVYLAHPPFNPRFFDRLSSSAYVAGLHRVEQATRDLAARHGLEVIGSFDPAVVGCEAAMYIDAEHANAQCLGKILRQFAELDAAADHDRLALARAGEARPAGGRGTISSGRTGLARKKATAKRQVAERRPEVIQDGAQPEGVDAAARPSRVAALHRPASHRLNRRWSRSARPGLAHGEAAGRTELGQ